MRMNARLVALISAIALVVMMLGGCGVEQNAENAEAQASNRAYMAKVNQIMDELSSKLDQFDDAVSRGDTVTMKTQLENAMTSLDNLENLEAPEVLSDIKDLYVEGCTSLKDALESYVDLYTEIETSADSFDYSSYEDRIADVQERYNEGISKLEEADAAATELS